MIKATRKQLAIECVVALSLVLTLIPGAGWAQQSSSSSSSSGARAGEDRPGAPPEAGNAGESSSQSAAEAPAPIPNQLQVQGLGKASLLRRDRSPLQYGPVYVDSALYFFAVGNGLRIDSTTNRLSKGVNTANVFNTNVVFDHLFGRNRVAVQYQPRVVTLNRQTQQDLSSHAFSVDGAHMFSPRWSLSFKNSYSYRQGRLLYGDSYVDVDVVSGNALQTPFVETRSVFISETNLALLSYQMSARDRFTFEPRFNYSHASFLSAPTDSYTYGSEFGWDHALSQTQSVGLSYSWQERRFSSNLTNTTYQAIGTSYSQQLANTWHFRATLAAGTAADRGERLWTVTGGLSLLKNFRRSLASVNYYRGNDFGGLLTNRYTDRADATYNLRLTRRWQLGGATGYYRAPRTTETVSGSYATAQVGYQLSPRVSWVATFGHKWQVGRTTDLLFSGGRSYFATGLRWEAHPQVPY